MKKKELLAPAGDLEAGYAAFYYGADAVYLGLQQFSARATATNFDEAALDELVGYAHSLGRKVFVALNTLLQESELPELIRQLDICFRCRVDALIIQDLGVARVVRENYPELEMHASTQMAVHNKEGALALQKLGFKRVVLARELTFAEINEIAALPGLDTEAFIHGALCYSYSGLCLFSSMESGRSANRGKCMYPCRAIFRGEEGEKHFFSMKDMALEETVLQMPTMSLKIEGRKKTALYVAAVTDYYRRILDGKGAERERADNIRQIFSRPWCRFHTKGRDKEVTDREFVGHRGLEIGKISRVEGRKILLTPQHKIERFDGVQVDIPGKEKPFGFSVQALRVKGKNVFSANAGEETEIALPPQAPVLKKGLSVYLASSTEVKGTYRFEKPKAGSFRQKQPIEVQVEVCENKAVARACGEQAEINGEFAPAEKTAKMTEAIEKAFAKTGETAFALSKVEIDNPQGCFVPASLLNELRRSLYAKIKTEHKAGSLPAVSKACKRLPPQWIIKTDNPPALKDIDLSETAEVIVEINPQSEMKEIYRLPKNKVRLALPAVCRKTEDYARLAADFIAQGYRKWEVSNYWGLSVLPENGIDLSFDAPLYCLNTQAIETAKELKASRICLSWEDTAINWKELTEKSPLPICLPVYEDVPLFSSAVCIRSNPCKTCVRGEKWLTLRKGGEEYEVLSKDCQTTVFNRKPLCLAAEAREIPADYYRVAFMRKNYSAAEAAEIWKKMTSFQDVDDCLKGNFRRQAL